MRKPWYAVLLLCLLPALGAAEALAAQENSATLAVLMGQLQSPDLPARTQAVLRLLELGPGAKEAFASLVRILADDEALDTAIAARALYAKAQPATEVARLAAALKFDTKARAPAAWELSRIGPSADAATVRALIAALVHPDKHERNFVVVALATSGGLAQDVVPGLLGVLRDPGVADPPQRNYKYPRAAAAIAIGLVGAAAREFVPVLVEILGEKGGWEFQRAANCFALGRIGPGAADALPALKRALQDASPIVRAHAATAIQAIAPLTEDAATASETPQARDVPALLRTLAGSPGRINPKVVEGLRALGEFAGASKPAGKKGSRKAAPPVHESIALALGYLDSLPHCPNSDEIARQEKTGAFTAEVRQYVMALGGVQQGIAPTLLEALAQGEQDARVLAVRQLAALGPAARDAIPALRAAMADADWILRREAFLALRRIESPSATPASP